MTIGAVFVGLGMLASAYWLKRTINKDEFNRTNQAGVQVFRDFGEAERTKIKHGFMNLAANALAIVGFLALLGGMFL